MKYRPEIDGLRALAVLGVIIFHFGLGLPGGYIGVDVFFVISGYLITGIIVRETAENKFSMQRFWIRRIRRILPAAAFLVLSCLIAGYFILEDVAFTSLGKSSLAYAVMLSNVFFWRSSGDYFAESAEMMPLMHTWSLSVEEQFYIVYPILMFLLLRRGQLTTLVSIGIVAIISLGLSIYGAINYSSGTFFLLPTRAWELIAGGLLVVIGERNRLNKPAKELLAWGGIAMIAVAMLFYSATTTFPGLAALLPVGGSVLFIFANQGTLTSAGKFFSLRPLVFIGLLSYSLYLWHWPILSFAKYLLIEPTAFTITIQLLLVALLSYLSWRYVETPLRAPGRLTKPLPAFSFGIISTGLVITIALIVIVNKGFPGRFSPDQQKVASDIYWSGSEYANDNTSGVPVGNTATTDMAIDFVLWGDSHGMAVADLVNELAKDEGLTGRALLGSSLPPVPGLFKPDHTDSWNKAALEKSNERMQWIISNNVKNVILVARWDAMIEGPLESEMTHVVGKTYSMVADSEQTELTPENSAIALERRLSEMLSTLAEHDVNVWILQQVPSASRPRVARDFYIARTFPAINSIELNDDTPLADYESIRKRSNDLFQRLNSPNVSLIDPLPVFYPEGGNLNIHSDRAFYRDEDHLTRAGSAHYLTDAFQRTMSEIAKQRQ